MGLAILPLCSKQRVCQPHGGGKSRSPDLRRRPGGNDGGPALRPCRREDARRWRSMAISCAISAATPSIRRRWRCSTSSAPLDALLVPPARQGRPADRRYRRRDGADRRFQPSAGPGPLHRADAAMGLPRLRRGSRPRLSGLHAADERGGHRLALGRGPGRRRDLQRQAASARSWSSPPTAAAPCSGRGRRCRSRISARRSTSSGSGSRRSALRTTAPPE